MLFLRPLLLATFLSSLLAGCGEAGKTKEDAQSNSQPPSINEQSTLSPVSLQSLNPSRLIDPPTSSKPSTSLKRWSDPKTWGNAGVPVKGDIVVIPSSEKILLDVDTPNLSSLSINGELHFERKNVSLTADSIDVQGLLQIGEVDQPFVHKAIVTLTGVPKPSNDGVSRGINVSAGGRLQLFGASPTIKWTKINAHAAAGSTTLILKDAVDWLTGDDIIVAPTEFYGLSETERFSLSQNNGAQLRIDRGLATARWGLLQYVTSLGMSLTPELGFVPPESPTPTVLDQRAVVGNLTRNIVIQGYDDAHWRNSGYGVHIMAMGTTSKLQLNGVEIRRAGQAGVIGRYPIHWHMMSYDLTGQVLPDQIGNYVKNSSIWASANRCVTIHATNGVMIQNNICYDIKGHAFFLEDAVERRNIFEGNLALKMRSPAANQSIQVHEKEIYQAGPSGFWITNPDNVVQNNHSGDAAGNGFWLSFPKTPLGLSKHVPLRPENMKHGVFENNVAHSNRGPGVLLEWVVSDDLGNVIGNKYTPTSDEGPDRYAANRVRFSLKKITSYKNLDGAYRNRVSTPDYFEWITADNAGTSFAGAGDDGWVKRGLFVGKSLNSRLSAPLENPRDPLTAFASYHSTFNMTKNVFVNFPAPENTPWGGVFKTDDYYVSAVDRGLIRNADNRLISSHPGIRTLPPNKRTDALNRPNSHYTLAGALWDPHGYWGTPGQYWVYDDPFLTSGANCQQVTPIGKNSLSCDGEYFGVGEFLTNFDSNRWLFKAAIKVDRINESGASLGLWEVANGNTSWALGNMRHFAARNGGRFVLTFPNFAPPKSISFSVDNLLRESDRFVMAVAFDGNTIITNASRSNVLVQPSQSLNAASSYASMMEQSGDHYFQDRANNLLWIKISRGSLPVATNHPVESSVSLYQSVRYEFN